MSRASAEGAVAFSEPRFDLRFQAGRGRLVLRRPVHVFPAKIDELTLTVALPRRFDLGRGVERLRCMRSTLEGARVELRWRELIRAAANAGVDLTLRGLRGGRVALATRDEGGVLAAELDVIPDGSELVFGLRRLDWVRDAPRPALERLTALLAPLGVRWQPKDGVFRMARPLRRILAEALLPAGYRLPEERALGLQLEVRRRGVWIRAAGSPGAADLDRYRRALDDPPLWLERALAGGPSAVASSDPADLPSPWLRGDAVRAQIEAQLAGSREPLSTERTDALLDALWIHRRDVGLWREWTLRLGERQDPAVLRLARAMLDLSVPEREHLVIEALTQAAEAGVPAEALEPILAEAERAAPASPHLWALRASLSEDGAQAAELWTRAADALGGDASALAARWLRSAAARLRDLRGAAAALPLARRAVDAAPGDVHALVLHAELLEAADRPGELAEAFARLLEAEPVDDAAEEVWERGLARAATFHTRRDERDRARPFLAALDDRVPFPTDAGARDEEPEPPTLPPAPPSAFDDVASGEIELDGIRVDDEPSGDFERPSMQAGEPDEPDSDAIEDWPKSEIWEAPPKDLMDGDSDEIDEAWSPSEVWDAEPRLADREQAESPDVEGEGPESGTHQAPLPSRSTDSEPPDEQGASSDAPPVTQIAVSDEEMRELIEDVRASEDPIALLEGALEGALADEDTEAVLRVLAALDRMGTLADQSDLRARALRWLRDR